MNQRRFIQEITQKFPNNAGVSFINKKALVRRLFEPEGDSIKEPMKETMTTPIAKKKMK